jgi:hypothetical protein
MRRSYCLPSPSISSVVCRSMSQASCQWSILIVPLLHVVVKQSNAALHAADPPASPRGPSSPSLLTKLRKRGTALVGLGADLIFSTAVLTTTFILCGTEYSVFHCPYWEGPASAKPRRNPGLRHEREDRDTVSVGLGSIMPFRLVHHSMQCLTRCSALGGIACMRGKAMPHPPPPRSGIPTSPSLSGGAENLTQRPHLTHRRLQDQSINTAM